MIKPDQLAVQISEQERAPPLEFENIRKVADYMLQQRDDIDLECARANLMISYFKQSRRDPPVYEDDVKQMTSHLSIFFFLAADPYTFKEIPTLFEL